MKIVVTGAAGFVGGAVVRVLRDRGDDVHPIPHRWTGLSELRSQLPTRVDRCLHVGWYAAPRDYLSNARENTASVTATIDLVDEVISRGCTAVVAAGTSAEYRQSSATLTEADPLEPVSVYGRAKVEAHAALRSRTVGVASLGWARLFNITGPGENPDRLLPSVARSVLLGRRMGVSSGEQVRDFLHVDDVVTALVAAVDAGIDGPVNVCRGSGLPLRDVLGGLASRLGDPLLLDFGALPRKVGDPDVVIGDSRRLRSLGWSPTYSPAQMLDATAEHWRHQISGG